jgi:hypothetical protein
MDKIHGGLRFLPKIDADDLDNLIVQNPNQQISNILHIFNMSLFLVWLPTMANLNRPLRSMEFSLFVEARITDVLARTRAVDR